MTPDKSLGDALQGLAVAFRRFAEQVARIARQIVTAARQALAKASPEFWHSLYVSSGLLDIDAGRCPSHEDTCVFCGGHRRPWSGNTKAIIRKRFLADAQWRLIRGRLMGTGQGFFAPP